MTKGIATAILVADGDGESRRTLAHTLREHGYDVCEAERGDEALAMARRERPHLAILEVPLRILSGYEVCRALKAEFGTALPVVFLSGDRTESYDRVAGLMIGADDYLVKPYAADELLARIRVLEGRSRRDVPALASRLTQRQQEVLGMLAEGLTQQEIAARLYISPKTVGTHIEQVLQKLGVHSRAQAVALALREDALIDDGTPARPGRLAARR